LTYYLDTHVVAWLFAGRLDLLPGGVRRLLDSSDLLISPMVELELQYLFEIQRTARPGREVIASLQEEIGLGVCDLPFHQVIAAAAGQSWTRDPFDRILVAQAMIRQAPLVTKDDHIRQHYGAAVWNDGGAGREEAPV
jgi:PIN domain nuclease of toxin-antitoxin system